MASHAKKAHCRGSPGEKGKYGSRGSAVCGPAPTASSRVAPYMSPAREDAVRRRVTQAVKELMGL